MRVFSDVFLGFAVCVVVAQFIRRHKYGPRVHWVPHRWRASLNQRYERHGWRPPYDEVGNKLRWWRNDP